MAIHRRAFPRNRVPGQLQLLQGDVQSDRREKRGWSTDYPGADFNFSTRLAELTKAPVTMRQDAEEGEAPDAVVVRLTMKPSSKCPYLLMQDAGTAAFTAAEATRLREYLLKGDFVFVSDYWGDWGKERSIRKLAWRCRRARTIVDLRLDHSIWRTVFAVSKVPQMPSIQSWRRTGGTLAAASSLLPQRAALPTTGAVSWW